jgi:hypothetical protein
VMPRSYGATVVGRYNESEIDYFAAVIVETDEIFMFPVSFANKFKGLDLKPVSAERRDLLETFRNRFVREDGSTVELRKLNR